MTTELIFEVINEIYKTQIRISTTIQIYINLNMNHICIIQYTYIIYT